MAQHDKQAHAVIGLSLPDELLEHVRGVNTAKGLLDSVYNVFKCRTLLSKLSARRDFHTVQMRAGERRILHINWVHHSGSVLKSMRVDTDNQEPAMSTHNELAGRYSKIITTVDTLGDDTSMSTLEILKSRLL